MKGRAGTSIKPGRKIDEEDGKENEQRGPEGKSMKGQARTSIKTGRKIDEGDEHISSLWVQFSKSES